MRREYTNENYCLKQDSVPFNLIVINRCSYSFRDIKSIRQWIGYCGRSFQQNTTKTHRRTERDRERKRERRGGRREREREKERQRETEREREKERCERVRQKVES